MIKGKIKTYKFEIVLAIILALCTLLKLTINKYFTAGLLAVSALVVYSLYKKKRVLKVKKKKILTTMFIFGILYVAVYYMFGIYTGFYMQTNKFGLKTIFNYIIPITLIIVFMEMIRDKLLIDSSNKSKILIIIIGTLVDISIYLDVYGFSNLESFLALVGFVSFAAISNNLLYTYICEKYGKEPVIIYKLITYLYLYFIPIAPSMYIFFRTFVRMIYPLLIYSYLDKYYNLDKERNSKDIKEQIITFTVGIIIMTIIIALISCKFLYGVLVIGSESMHGSIDKGDVVFFKSEKNNIKTNDVIIFEREDLKIVHRVIKVKSINNEVRYYTKGDANNSQDEGYVTEENLVGKVLFKIKYIGKPTLWLRESFNKER